MQLFLFKIYTNKLVTFSISICPLGKFDFQKILKFKLIKYYDFIAHGTVSCCNVSMRFTCVYIGLCSLCQSYLFVLVFYWKKESTQWWMHHVTVLLNLLAVWVVFFCLLHCLTEIVWLLEVKVVIPFTEISIIFKGPCLCRRVHSIAYLPRDIERMSFSFSVSLI